eukprot:130478-Rhodomonas_salina.1
MRYTLLLPLLFFWASLLPPTSSEDSSEGTCLRDDSHSLCRERAQFGAAKITEHDMSSRDAGGSFDMDVHFTITTLPSRPHLVNSVRGLVFTNGNLGGICAGAGPCAIAVQDMPAGFYEVRILLMDSQWLEGSDKAYECSERQHSCIALLAMESYKVNFFHVTLLSTVVDPFSPMLEQSTVNPHGRPSSLVLENTYEVNDEGDVLSDLLVSDGGKQVTFVSPLVPRPNEINAIRESSWECRFQGLDQASVGTVSSDGAHTYRISCPVPDSLPSFQTGASVAVGVFRDGDAIAPENVFRKPEQMRLPTESAGPAPVEICTMVRNEEAFVVEWVEYHLMLGVAHIHIYLHLTSDSAALLLEPYVQRGQVSLLRADAHHSRSARADLCVCVCVRARAQVLRQRGARADRELKRWGEATCMIRS